MSSDGAIGSFEALCEYRNRTGASARRK